MAAATQAISPRRDNPAPWVLARRLILAVLAWGCLVMVADHRQAEAQATPPRAGIVSILEGKASAAQPSASERPIEKDSVIFVGDLVSTGPSGRVGMLLDDGTTFEIGAEASLVIDEFVFNPATSVGKVSGRIVAGAFRFVSGQVAANAPANMAVRTPVGTIGVRGTSVAGTASATRAEVILLEPEGQPRPTSIVVANAFGSVVIDQPGFGTEIPDANSPPSAPRQWDKRQIDSITNTFRNIAPRMNLPRRP